MAASANAPTIADPHAMTGACDRCIHRRALPGNTHIGCHHPRTAPAHTHELAGLIEAIGGALPMAVPGLTVIGDRHGIRMGWFAWPFNFDPNWLVSCDGFEKASQCAGPAEGRG